MTALDLGMLSVPVQQPRRRSRQVLVGDVPVGGGAPVSVQSMTTTLTADVDATLQQIAELTSAGCDIVRVAVPSQDDADALPVIARRSTIPVIADIHFQPRYVFAAIDAGCAAVRVNPGNIKKFDDKIREIAHAAEQARVPIRIGVNAGSLDARLLTKHGKATPEALVESALAFGILLAEGIGDTIRVSLTAPPVEEVKVGTQILSALGLRPRTLEIVSCPSCGRAQVDVYTLTTKIQAAFEDFPHPLRVAVMGCVVNGPGEAREADLGVSSGNGKGQIFVKGQIIKTVPEHQIVDTLLDEALKLTARHEART